MRTRRSSALWLSLALAVVSVAIGPSTSASASASIPLPTADSFYRYTGAVPLARIKPGTVLKSRQVSLALQTSSIPRTATQILYRTNDSRGRAVVSVTTVILPVTGTAIPHVVGYMSFYDALTSKCDPSYTLRGGDPGGPNQQTSVVEQVLNNLVSVGDIVTIPDFENEGLDYVAGRESGMSALDGIRATLTYLSLSAHTTPVALMGYSGGSIAADWASELKASYAPELNIVGVAAGGIPVDLSHNLKYIDGSPSWSDVIPAAILGIARSYGISLTPYLSRFGRHVLSTEAHQCIGEFQGEWPHLHLRQLFKPRFHSIDQIGILRRTMNRLIMGSVPGRPQWPWMIVAGNADGIGDDVMIAGDERALARSYCRRGVSVDYVELQGLSHTNAGIAFMPLSLAFVQARFLGLPTPSNCSSIKPGNSLAPVPAPRR